MNREELVEDAENAITTTYHHGGDWDDCAAAAVDAVLSAVADWVAASAESFPIGTGADEGDRRAALALQITAACIRALLGGKEGQDQ